MKLFKNKLLIISSIIILLVISYNALAANTFPTTLNDWSAGETIESDWADALEAKIGIDSSAVVTSLDYKISDIISNYLQLAGGTMTNTLIIDQNSNARGINIDSEAVDWESLKIDSISTIRDAVYFYSNAVKNANVAVLRIQDNNASNQQPAFIVDQNGNGQSLRIDSESTSATVLNIDAVNTSGNIVNVDSKFVIDYAGNVGIGNISPTNLLLVDGTGDANVNFPTFKVTTSASEAATYGSEITTISGNRATLLVENSASSGAGRTLIVNASSTTGNILEVQDGGSSVFVVQDGGNVGIGTASPSDYQADANNLVIYETGGNGGMSIVTDNTKVGKIFFADGSSGDAEYRGYITYDHGAILTDALQFGTAASLRMTIDNTGKVGIGTSTPAELLSVAGNILADQYIEYSPRYAGNALEKIKDIKCEEGTQNGDWCHIDHATLPDGVKYEREDGFVGRDLGKSTQFNLKAIQELYEENLQQQAEIIALKIRMDKLDGLGTDLVIVDESGNLLSNSLWAGFGGLISAGLALFILKRKKQCI